VALAPGQVAGRERNHPRKIVALEGFGIEIVGQEPVEE
jgi:hypothetical protein